MTLHQLLPLGAFLLNVILVTLALVRNGGSRLNRVFAYCVGSMAIWNFGAFLLRRAPDEQAAWAAEVVIHAAVALVPAFYYHFVLIFLDATRARRRSLALAYGVAGVFSVLNLIGSPLFMTGVKATYWGWAPTPGPLYLVYTLFLHACMIVGPWLLIPLGLAGLCFARAVGGVRPRPSAERTIVRERPEKGQHSAREAGYLIYAAFVPAYAIAVALFFIAERYRLPLLVPLCAGAGAAIDWAWTTARARGLTALAVPAAIVAALAIAANWPLHLNNGRWDEGLRMAQQLVILERYDEADQWAERLDTRGDAKKPGDGHYGVGSQLLVLNQPQRALVHLERERGYELEAALD